MPTDTKPHPCPFCNTDEFISVFPVDDDVPRLRYDVECNNCGRRVYFAGSDEKTAIERWNFYTDIKEARNNK